MADVADAARTDLSHKADNVDVTMWLDSKADARYVEQALALRAEADAVESLSRNHAALESKVSSISNLGSKLDALQKDFLSKMSTDRGVYVTLEGKANIEDVNKALLDVCHELESRVSMEQLELVAKDQALLKANLQQVSTMARWLWKSGRTKGGGAVPWNLQTLNTDPANFIFEVEKTVVVAMLPGLYEVSFGFFSKCRPVVQVLVNGEVVLTAVGNSSTAVHHQVPSEDGFAGQGSHQEQQHVNEHVHHHSAGHVTGNERAEAFLTLRKL
eukprot:gene3117-13129_t